MVWIEPLSLDTIIVSVFSGTPEIFISVAILVIMGMAGYFRMKGASLFFILGVFFLMFTGDIPDSLLNFLMIITGLIIGYVMANIIQK